MFYCIQRFQKNHAPLARLAACLVWGLAAMGAAGAFAAGPQASRPLGAESLEGKAVTCAVATNFLPTLKVIVKKFREAAGPPVRLVGGSTGKLFAQIVHGAPFDVFLAADRVRPQLLEKRGLAVPGSRFTYARGRLVLWSATADIPGADLLARLRRGDFERLAIANPKTAPYGAAARTVLTRMGLWDGLRRRLVRGENIGQAFQFAATGNAAAGFVALSQVLNPNLTVRGSRWDVPETWHDPLDQDAVLLRRSQAHAGAQKFLAFLKGPQARAVMQRFGYRIP